MAPTITNSQAHDFKAHYDCAHRTSLQDDETDDAYVKKITR